MRRIASLRLERFSGAEAVSLALTTFSAAVLLWLAVRSGSLQRAEAFLVLLGACLGAWSGYMAARDSVSRGYLLPLVCALMIALGTWEQMAQQRSELADHGSAASFYGVLELTFVATVVGIRSWTRGGGSVR